MPAWRLARFSLALVLVVGGCSDQGSDSGCPEGSSERTSEREVSDPSLQSREGAIQTGLDEIGMAATDEAIADAIVHAVAVPNSHDEDFTIRTGDGIDVMMTLTPLDPGWAVRDLRWCEPL